MVDEAKGMVDSNATIALLLLENDGSVLLEEYRQGATAESQLLSMSMAKSLTSIAVGQALCDGLLPSLDTAADEVSADLQQTSYGKAKVRELLMMASGGTREVFAGEPSLGWTSSVWLQSTTLKESIKRFNSSTSANKLGSFNYKNLDTTALGFVVSGASNRPFAEYFQSAVWERVGAEAAGHWMTDSNGDAVVHGGFNARLRDWGRLALYVRDQLFAQEQSSCMRKYLRAATKKQISNFERKSGRAFSGYGYQFWTNNDLMVSPTAWMSGFGGQRIGIDLQGGRIMVLFSFVEDYMVDVYKLFDRWTRY